jgi:hypothetical protein
MTATANSDARFANGTVIAEPVQRIVTTCRPLAGHPHAAGVGLLCGMRVPVARRHPAGRAYLSEPGEHWRDAIPTTSPSQ